MSTASITAIIAIAAALVVASIAGVLHNRRSGVIRQAEAVDIEIGRAHV